MLTALAEPGFRDLLGPSPKTAREAARNEYLAIERESPGSLTPDLAFNTAASFATNTDWQNYGGETTMSYLTQVVGLTVQNFVSAASGMAVMVTLIRGSARRSAATIGNFWVDLTRTTLYILLPLSFVFTLVLVRILRESEADAHDRSARTRWSSSDGFGLHMT